MLLQSALMPTDPLIQQVAIAAFASKLIELLKNTRYFPFLAQHTVTANRTLSVIVSLAASAGIVVGWNGSLEQGGVLTIAVPSGAALFDFACHAVFQFCAQETVYQGIVRQTKPEAFRGTGTVSPAGQVQVTGISAEVGSDAAEKIK